MKRFARIMIIFSSLLICAASVVITCKILLTEFTPVAVCAGENTFALAERLKNRWYVSVFGPDGELMHDISFSAENSDREALLCYSEDTYYFGAITHSDANKGLMNVYKVSSNTDKKDSSVIQLVTQEKEQLYDLHIKDDTLSVVSSCSQNGKTEVSVYLAGSDSQSFSQSHTYTLPQNYFIRNAYYLSDGSVVFLTASGRVYSISKAVQTPILFYDGSELPPTDICLDEEENVCLLNCGGKAFKITNSENTEPILQSMSSIISHNNPKVELSDFTDISLMNDNYASAIFPVENDKWEAAFYQNGMLNTVDNVIHYSWWVFIVVFLGLLILLGTVVFMIAFGVWRFFNDTVTMQYRISAVSIAVAVIILSIISFDIYSVYTRQKEEQNWERLTIMLNNAEVYLEPDIQENVKQLSELDWDNDIQIAETNEFLQRLWSFSNSDASENSRFLMFVGDSCDKLTAISGTSKQIGKSPEQIYDSEATSMILNMVSENNEMFYIRFLEYGISWISLAKPIVVNGGEGKGFIIIQMPQENEKELWIFTSVLLLCMAVVGFVIILLLRIRRILSPLRQMEIQAQKFMVTGNCDTIPIKGHNEITVLTRRFYQAVAEMKRSMEQSKRSAESYERFVDKNWISLMAKENLSALQSGTVTKKVLAVLEMHLTAYDIPKHESEQIKQYQQLYEDIIPIVKKNNGIAENLSHDHMRFLFSDNCFDAVCTASMIREIVHDRYKLEAIVDYGQATIKVCGSSKHSRIFSELENESVNMPLLYQKCREFGCCILVTGEVIQGISDFQTIFNSRIIGFFSNCQNDKGMLRLIEILSQRCSDTFELAVRFYHAGRYSQAFALFSSVAEKDPNDHAAIRYLYLCDTALKQAGK